MIAIKKDAMRYRDPETGKFVGVSLIGGDAPSGSGGATVEIDSTLTQSGKAADAKAVGDRLSALNQANAAQDERLTTLEQAGGIVTVEPAEDDVPLLFYSEALPQTKTNTAMPITYVSKTLKRDDTNAETKAQGTSSLNYPKKNQTTKFSQAINFKNWGLQKKYCMKANWIDLTHARNIVSAQLWGDVVKSRANYLDLPELLRNSPNQGAIDGFPALVYANGVYQGRYTINIPKDGWMANMDKTLDTHCILCGENYVSGCFRAAANINGSDWSDELHDIVPDAIKTRWNEVISFVMNSTDEEFKANLGNYFYVDSLIDYYIFGVVTCGLDAFGKNQIYMTYDGQKWIASMYDMDSTWGLWWNGGSFVATNYARTEFQDFKDGQGNLLYIRLEELFYEQIQARWAELKNSVLSYANIMTRFERFIDIVPPHIVKEDYASTTGGGNFTGIPSKDTNHIQQIRAYVAARLPYADEWFASLTPAVQIPCTGITLDQSTLTFTAAGTQTLTATVTPSNTTDTVVWSSDAPSIASVNGGVVTAKANGSATITAMCGAYSATCAVSVSGIGGGSGDDLPGYTLVDNIASDGKAWIDTGVSGGTSSAYEIDFDPRWSATIEYEQYFAGTKTAPHTPKIYSGAHHTKVEFTNGNTPNANVETPTTGWTRMLVSYQGGNSLTVDGVEHTLSGSHENLGWGSETWYVFNSHSESNLPASMVLYLLKMWKDGELVRDFVPAKRNADNMIGLYDKVEDKFYTSIGSGNFYLYSEYTNRITYNNVQLTAGSAISSEDGTVVTSNNGKYSPEYFELLKEPVVGALCFAGVSGATWYSLAFYDSEKNYVSGSSGDIARNIIVPDDVAYVRVSVFNASTDTLSLTVAK